MTYTPITIGAPDWGGPVNSALSSQDARITAREAMGSASYGVYTPPGWGQFWRTKRNAAGSAQARAIVVGDSISEGFFATNTNTTSWVSRMRATVQAQYGDGGSGMFTAGRFGEASSVSAGILATWRANGSYGTSTGTWTQSGLFFGPGITLLNSTAASSLTFPGIRGTTVKIYNISGAAPRANFTYSIDGGAPVLVTVNVGSTAVQVTTVTGLSDTTHTVVLTWSGNTNDPLFIVGVEGERSTGVIVDNLAKSGSRTSQWTSNATFGPPYNGGVNYPADLVIYSLGVNDANNSVAGDAWVDNVTNHLQAIRAANNGATDIIMVHQHIGKFGTDAVATPKFYGEYSSRIRDLAENYNAVLVNLWTSGRNSWDYSNSQSYWGDPNTAGITGADTVHLSDTGHQTVANIITPIVMS